MSDAILKQTKLHISKKDAIESHITSVVELLFNFQSYPSAHVLAFAAWEMLEHVGQQNGITTSKNDLFASIKPEWRAKIKIGITDAYNALKHANRDPDRDIVVNIEFLIFVLLQAIIDFQLIYNDRTIAMSLFQIWCHFRFPEIVKFNDSDLTKSALKSSVISLFKISDLAGDLQQALHIGKKVLEVTYSDIEVLFPTKWPFRITELTIIASS